MITMATEVNPYTVHSNDTIIGEYHPDKRYVLRVRDLPTDEKPREKLLCYGPAGLSSAELIAILLGVGTKREEVLVMARRILREYGDRAIITETNPEKLASALSIPLGKACQLIASFELGRRSFERHSNGRPRYVRTALQAYEYVKAMAESNKEQLRGLYLNSRYQVIHDEVISVGSLTANIVHPREVFQPAVEHGAVAVIIAHNHPSGVTTPTSEDVEVTAQLVAAGKILGIDLLDHLVVTNEAYKSVMEEQL